MLPATELAKTGKTSPRDLISTLIPSATTSNSGAGASFAVKTVSLRGLDADQVLVLVNGKRRHNTAILFVNGTTQNGQSPPDLDLIPTAGIDHIEVLRDSEPPDGRFLVMMLITPARASEPYWAAA